MIFQRYSYKKCRVNLSCLAMTGCQPTAHRFPRGTWRKWCLVLFRGLVSKHRIRVLLSLCLVPLTLPDKGKEIQQMREEKYGFFWFVLVHMHFITCREWVLKGQELMTPIFNLSPFRKLKHNKCPLTLLCCWPLLSGLPPEKATPAGHSSLVCPLRRGQSPSPFHRAVIIHHLRDS